MSLGLPRAALHLPSHRCSWIWLGSTNYPGAYLLVIRCWARLDQCSLRLSALDWRKSLLFSPLSPAIPSPCIHQPWSHWRSASEGLLMCRCCGHRPLLRLFLRCPVQLTFHGNRGPTSLNGIARFQLLFSFKEYTGILRYHKTLPLQHPGELRCMYRVSLERLDSSVVALLWRTCNIPATQWTMACSERISNHNAP